MTTLLMELDAFYLEHRRCGELDGGVDGAWPRVRCECGAELLRRVDEDEGRL